MVFELKRPSMSVQNLFFARPAPKKPIAAAFSNNWLWKKAKKCSPTCIFRIFHTIGLLSPPEREIRAGKLLVDPGHLQEELVGGHPHHRYIKACRCRPRIDRGLQKNTHIPDDHAKKLLEASVSLKWTVFKLCCPAHLFPNTPRTYWIITISAG